MDGDVAHICTGNQAIGSKLGFLVGVGFKAFLCMWKGRSLGLILLSEL